MSNRIIVVDLDGTLIRTDTLVECFLRAVKRNPLMVFAAMFWLTRGKAYLKERLARVASIDVTLLPYRAKVVDWIKTQRDQGACIVMATAASEAVAESVATHVGLFDEVLSSSDGHNLKSSYKSKRLNASYGAGAYEYVGDTYADEPVWETAAVAHMVAPPARLQKRVAAQGKLGEVFEDDQARGTWREILRSMRIHQWAKNLLVFLPLAAAQRVNEVDLLFLAVAAFLAFSAVASSVYVLNDLLDLEEDRAHRTKKERPFASGRLGLYTGIVLVPGLCLFGFALALALLPLEFVLLLGTYFVTTLGYSFFFKRIVLIDVFTLAMLYVLRVLAGVAALSLQATFWMLAFCIFLFASLAFVKRYAEVQGLQDPGASMAGRGYLAEDRSLLLVLGVSLGVVSALVLSLYINDAGTAASYARPEMLWAVVPVFLFWICRVWLLAQRGDMHDDPVVFALRDNVSRWIGLICVAIFLLAV